MGGRGIVFVVILSPSAYMMAIHILKTLLPFIAMEIGASGIQVVRILYIGFIMFAFLPPVAGFISDVFGYKRTIVSTAVLESVFMFMYAFVRSYVELFAVRIFQALVGVILSASFLHFASTYAKRAGIYIGLLRFSQALGMALGSLVVFLFPVKQVRVFILIASILCLMPVSVVMLGEYCEPRKHVNLRNVLQCVISGDLVFYYASALANTLTDSILFSYIVVYMIESFEIDISTYALIIFMTTIKYLVFRPLLLANFLINILDRAGF